MKYVHKMQSASFMVSSIWLDLFQWRCNTFQSVVNQVSYKTTDDHQNSYWFVFRKLIYCIINFENKQKCTFLCKTKNHTSAR